jgi:hypothetical protein
MAVLERPGETGSTAPIGTPAGDVSSFELDGAARRQVEAADDVDERRLAGAVRADQADDLPAAKLEGDVPQRVDALEGARNGGGPERRTGPPRLPFVAQIFGTTFATTVPTTFGTLFWILITR